jgi:LPS-assembly lipoprotein
MKSLLVAALTFTLLSGCGWQLRGTESLPDNLQSLHFRAKDPDSNLARTLQRTFKNYQITLSDQAQGQYSLILQKESQDKRVVSLSIDALANEYELSMSARFRILDPQGKVILKNTDAKVLRSFDHDPSDALSKSEEERLLRQEMQSDLINQIIRQLRFVLAKQQQD